MRPPLLLLLAALLSAAPSAHAQHDSAGEWNDAPKRPTGGYFGGSLVLADTRGEFAEHVEGGLGGQAYYVHRLDREGWLALRAEGGFLVYGHESYRVPLSSTIGGRVLVDVNTSNNIAFVGVGPQIGVPNGRLRPYLNGHVGGAYLFTQSSVEGTAENEDFASTTNFEDWTWAYGGGAGVYVPLRGGPAPISLDVGTTYRNNGSAEYLREGDIQDNPDGSITIFPTRSDTDLWTFHVGVSIGIAR